MNYFTEENIVRHFIENMADQYPSIKIKGINLNAIPALHDKIGYNIRNQYRFWMNDNPLTSAFFKADDRSCHPAEVSLRILGLVWRKLNENWPFLDFSSGAALKEKTIYAFSDSGGLYGQFNGYTSVDEATKHVQSLDPDTDWEWDEMFSYLPGFLGEKIVIISGREFIDQLYKIADNNSDDVVGEAQYGVWKS